MGFNPIFHGLLINAFLNGGRAKMFPYPTPKQKDMRTPNLTFVHPNFLEKLI